MLAIHMGGAGSRDAAGISRLAERRRLLGAVLMGQASKIARYGEAHVTFWCPGCGQAHAITVNSTNAPSWGWNGDYEKPTFTPSILAHVHKLEHDDRGEWTGEWCRDAEGKLIDITCHSFVTDGMIQFLGDCTHHLANQTVPIPDLPPAMRDEQPD